MKSGKDYREGARQLIKASEKTPHFPDEFVKTIEYLSETFLYILSLIQVKEEEKDIN